MSLGERIRVRREELGLARGDLVKASGISYPYVSQIENDERTPSLDKIKVLAQVLRLPLEVLLAELQDAAPPARPGAYANPLYAPAAASAAPPPPPAPARAPHRDRETVVADVLAALDGVPAEQRLGLLGDVTTQVVRDLARASARGRRT